MPMIRILPLSSTGKLRLGTAIVPLFAAYLSLLIFAAIGCMRNIWKHSGRFGVSGSRRRSARDFRRLGAGDRRCYNFRAAEISDPASMSQVVTCRPAE
jgi:hypothetical protein